MGVVFGAASVGGMSCSSCIDSAIFTAISTCTGRNKALFKLPGAPCTMSQGYRVWTYRNYIGKIFVLKILVWNFCGKNFCSLWKCNLHSITVLAIARKYVLCLIFLVFGVSEKFLTTKVSELWYLVFPGSSDSAQLLKTACEEQHQ